MKLYYDYEYERLVDETIPEHQYRYFKENMGYTESYETFLKDNFWTLDKLDELELEYLKSKPIGHTNK